MKLVFLGPPGAGKGTQAKLLAEKRAIAHISTGEMLRAAVAAGTPLGMQVKGILDAGQLVPDDVMISVIHARTAESDCAKGYILDGFPRTVPQAEALGSMLKSEGSTLSKVVLFDVSEADLSARLANRRGAEARADDDASVQLERLRVYHEKTAPLIDYYARVGELSRVSGAGSVEQVQKELEKVLEGLA